MSDEDLDGVPVDLPWGLSRFKPSSMELLQGVNLEEKKRKTNPFQKHLEEQKAREEKEKAEVNAVYHEFLNEFVEKPPEKKTYFVRGETVLGERTVESSKGLSASDRIYDPQGARRASGFDVETKPTIPSKTLTPFQNTATPTPEVKKKRAIDELREQLEGNPSSLRPSSFPSRGDPLDPGRSRGGSSGNPSSSSSYGLSSSSGDLSARTGGSSDPLSTNLYVGNLSNEVTEETLFEEFSPFGPISTLKIARVRNDDPTPRFCGFVTFIKREDAADAMEELNGIKLKGNTLRVEWSKSVPNMPREPLTLDRLYEMYPRLKPSSHSHRHRHDDDHDADEHRSHHHHHHSSSHSSSAPDRHSSLLGTMPGHKLTSIVVPSSTEQKTVIESLAEWVFNNGKKSEDETRQFYGSQPLYAFLLPQNSRSPEALYYHFLLSSFTKNGSARHSWDPSPVSLFSTDELFLPPPCPGHRSHSQTYSRSRSRSPGHHRSRKHSKSPHRRHRSQSRSHSRSRSRSRSRDRGHKSRRGERRHSRSRSQSPVRRSGTKRSRSRSHSRGSYRSSSHKDKSRSRSRSYDRHRKSSRGRSRSRSRGRRSSSTDDSRSRSASRSSSRSSSRSRSRDRPRRVIRGFDQKPTSSSSSTVTPAVVKMPAMPVYQPEPRPERDRTKREGASRRMGHADDVSNLSDDFLPADLTSEFQFLLAKVNYDRTKIGTIMALALDHAKQSVPISHLLREALINEKSTIQNKVACLYVISDILHNMMSVPLGTNFKKHLEPVLPEIFSVLGKAWKALQSRITSANIKERITTVLGVWESWSLFSPQFLKGLHVSFLLLDDESIDTLKQKSKISEDIDGVPLFEEESSLSLSFLATLGDEELRKTCRLHGTPSTGSRDQIIQRLHRLGEIDDALIQHNIPISAFKVDIPKTKPKHRGGKRVRLAQSQKKENGPEVRPRADPEVDGTPMSRAELMAMEAAKVTEQNIEGECRRLADKLQRMGTPIDVIEERCSELQDRLRRKYQTNKNKGSGAPPFKRHRS